MFTNGNDSYHNNNSYNNKNKDNDMVLKIFIIMFMFL